MQLTIRIDDREKLPYDFASVKRATPYELVREHLPTGDYSVRVPSIERRDQIVIERKSLADLYSTLGQHRERFEAEFARLSEFGYPAVIVEATWDQICAPNEHLRHPSGLHPRSVVNTLISWSQRYRVHIWPVPGRWFAEQFVFRALEKWHKEHA